MLTAESDKNKNGRLIIVGPSHVIRWQHGVSAGVIESPAERVEFIGGGGLPVWSADLEARCRAFFERDDRILLVVGDFRFGNAICDSPEYWSPNTFLPSFRNIERRFIDPAVDLSLFHRSLRALDAWRQIYGPHIRIMHWTSLMRRAEDVWAKRHVVDGIYRHPIWHTEKLESEDLDQLAQAPVVRMRSLSIDDNLHPSPLGYRFLQNRAANIGPIDSVREAVGWLCARLQNLFQQPVRGGLLIAGDSVFINFCNRLLVGEPLDILKKFGIYFYCGNIDEIEFYLREHKMSALMLVMKNSSIEEVNTKFASDILKEKFAETMGLEGIMLVPWEIIVRSIISKRHRDLAYLSIDSREEISTWLMASPVAPSGFSRLDDLDHIVDLGEEMLPTLGGVEAVLSEAIRLSSRI